MSDGLDIRSGGAIAVDTATLRAVAAGFATIAGKLDEVQADLMDQRARLVGIDPAGTAGRFETVVRCAQWATDAATGLSDRVAHAATVYEFVELRAEREAARTVGDDAAVAAADARLEAIRREHPLVIVEAAAVLTAWWMAGPHEISRQAGLSPFGALGASGVGAIALAVGMAGRGRLARDAVLTGSAGPVAVSSVGGASTSGTAPTSLASVVDRMPRDQARVRVERYAMPNGSNRFAVYVAGTRSPIDIREPWNLEASVKLYQGERTASYDATVKALEYAGAKPGDAIYQFGHSQGGMITSHIALESAYDTKAVVTFGSPVSADVGPDTLSVQLRHTDDPVIALADGGHPAGVGADGSIIAERVADPTAGVQDIGLKAHGLAEYRETAAVLDASSDPRANVLDDMFDELGTAQSVEVFEYASSHGSVTAPAAGEEGMPAA